ncbi:hypothetical protein [Fodinicola feengrottensis]
MAGTFDQRGQLVIGDGRIISCFGKKRSGKSIMGTLLFRSYPGDRIVIDVAGDDGPMGPDVVDLKGTVVDLPRRWPESKRKDKERMTLRYVPDPGSPTRLEDVDAVVALALSHGDCALLIHEVNYVAPSGRVPAHMSRLLHQNRHRNVTAILCDPRPITVDALVLAQSDVVYVFEMNVVQDRERIAQTIGWNTKDFAEGVTDLGPHEYLRYDANQPKPASDDDPDYRLVHFPALPEDVAKQTYDWAHGGK